MLELAGYTLRRDRHRSETEGKCSGDAVSPERRKRTEVVMVGALQVRDDDGCNAKGEEGTQACLRG